MSRRPGPSGPHRIPLLPPVPGRRELATSWWGDEWIDTLETASGLAYDAGHTSRLSRARTYARKGAVGEITVRAGWLAARVQGSGRTPYRCEIHVPELAGNLWEQLFEAWADDGPGLLQELEETRPGDAVTRSTLEAQVPLVPLPGELAYHCSCPDWGDPCKHAAALSYQFARALDSQPAALLVLRGRASAEVYAEVAIRAAERARALVVPAEGSTTSAEPAGVPAGEVFARARQADAPPALPPLPAPVTGGRQGAVPNLASAPGLHESVDPDALLLLADDAARRAATTYACAVEGPRPATATPQTPTGTDPADAGALLWLDGGPWHDTVRRAAAADDPHLVGRLLNSSDQARARLARASVAWRHGGAPALAALEGEHVPDREAETAARAQLLRVSIPGRSGPPKTRRTRGRLQLVGEDVELRWGPRQAVVSLPQGARPVVAGRPTGHRRRAGAARRLRRHLSRSRAPS